MLVILRNAIAAGAVLGALISSVTIAAGQVPQSKFVIAQANQPAAKKKEPNDKTGSSKEQAAPNVPKMPQPEVLLIMVRAALIALDQANKANNYTVLHALGGPMLQQNPPEKLAQMFADVRKSNVDLQPILVLTPQITEAPVISPQQVLVMTGLFPTQPLQIRFQVAYQPVAGVWRIGGISLGLAPVKAATPAPAAKKVPPKSGKSSPANKKE